MRRLVRQGDWLPLRGARAIAILVGLLDLVVVAAALLLAAGIGGAPPLDTAGALSQSILLAGITATWMLMLRLHGGFVAPCVRGSRATVRAVMLGSFSAVVLVAATVWTAEIPVPKGYVALGFALGVPLLLLSRWASCVLVRSMWSRGWLERRVIVLGELTQVRDVSTALKREERLSGMRVAAGGVLAPSGTWADTDTDTEAETGAVRVLRSVDDVVAVCAEADADAALVAGSWGSAQELRRLSWELADRGIDLFIAPDATDIGGVRMELLPIAGLPLLHVDKPRVGQAGGVAKRILDVILSSAAVVVLAPLVLVIIVLIKLEDHGPVYFRQTRIGRHGEPFTLLKFRTMQTDAESRLAKLRELNEADGLLFKLKDDPRVTKVGKYLRSSSLDELPQLFNVIRGAMSLVGPRPPLPSEAARYEHDVHRRLLVRPGLTGLWQISGRSTLSWSESVRLDLYYVDNWSMADDLMILAKTAKAVLWRRGAY